MDLERAAPASPVPYDPFFLGGGFEVPFPRLGAAALGDAHGGGVVFDYVHFSLVMNRRRRLAVFSAANIDAARMTRVPKGRKWVMDSRLPESVQVGDDFYRGNSWDRGHLTRREDVKWGPVAEAKAAVAASCYFTNAAPQHENFNQDEWLELESWVLDHAPESDYKLCVITGPVFRDDDEVLGGVAIPSAFWKIIVARSAQAAGQDLSALAFLMRQDGASDDKHGAQLNNLATYQIGVDHLGRLTGLDFGPLREADELAWELDRSAGLLPAVRRIRGPEDLVLSGDRRRARGGVAPRSSRSGASRPAVLQFSPQQTAPARSVAMPIVGGQLVSNADCGCKRAPMDAERAVLQLRDEVQGMFDAILGRMTAAGGEKAAADAELRSFRSATYRIVGGEPTGRREMMDCVCLGDSRGSYFCTGTLIARRLVLTAAHCVVGGGVEQVLFGSSLSDDRAVVPVRSAIVHPAYVRGGAPAHDLALLVLDEAVPDTVASPTGIVAPRRIGDVQEVVVAGFGYSDPVRPLGFGTKRKATVGITALRRSQEDLATEEALYGFGAETEMVAGRKESEKDTCNGDSGGPAYVLLPGSGGRIERLLLGVTSRATRHATKPCGQGGVYTVAAHYRAWIADVAREASVRFEDEGSEERSGQNTTVYEMRNEHVE